MKYTEYLFLVAVFSFMAGHMFVVHHQLSNIENIAREVVLDDLDSEIENVIRSPDFERQLVNAGVIPSNATDITTRYTRGDLSVTYSTIDDGHLAGDWIGGNPETITTIHIPPK